MPFDRTTRPTSWMRDVPDFVQRQQDREQSIANRLGAPQPPALSPVRSLRAIEEHERAMENLVEAFRQSEAQRPSLFMPDWRVEPYPNSSAYWASPTTNDFSQSNDGIHPAPIRAYTISTNEPPELEENLEMFIPPKIDVRKRFAVAYDEFQNATVTIDNDLYTLKHKSGTDDVDLLRRFTADFISSRGSYARSCRKFILQASDIKEAEILPLNVSDVQLTSLRKALTEKLEIRTKQLKDIKSSLQRLIYISYHTIANYLITLYDYERYKEVYDAIDGVLSGSISEAYIAPINDLIVFWCADNEVNPKNNKYQYRLSTMNKDTNFVDLPPPLENQVYRLTKTVAKEKQPIIITSKTLYTDYVKDLAEFNKYYKSFRTSITEQVVLNDMFGNRHQGSICMVFRLFNMIKANLIIYGETEAQAVRTILDDAKIANKKTFTCSVTKQLLPDFFGVTLGDQRLSCYYVAMNSRQSDYPTRMGGSNPFYIERKRNSSSDIGNSYSIVRNVLSEDSFKYSVIQDHAFNALTYLSPRKSLRCCNKLTTYHSTYIPTPYLGIELEVEQNANWKPQDVDMVMPKLNIAEDVYNTLGRDFIILKRDGSLSGHNPFEIVTIPATLQYHKERWKPFLEADIKKHLKSFNTSTCGMHIHISRDSFTGLHLAKFMRFINLGENKHFVETIAQRPSNEYSKYKDMPLKDHVKNLNGDMLSEEGSRNRRQAVNCTNKNTVEVRIFKGNLGTISFLKNMEFVHSLYYYTRDCAIGDLSYKKYLTWLLDPANSSDMYTNLRLWLVKKKFNIDSVVIKKDTPPELVKRLEVQQKTIKIKKSSIARSLINKRFSKDDIEDATLKDRILAVS